MIKIYDHSNILDSKFLKSCIKDLKNYFKKHPCCNFYPSCEHPKNQTDTCIFKQNNNNFKKLEKTYIESVEKFLRYKPKYNFINCWGYINKKGQVNNKDTWHIHHEKSKKSNFEIAGLMYLNDTDLGTEFKTEDIYFKTIPKKAKWYIWNANILHRPEPGINEKERFVIATTIGIVN